GHRGRLLAGRADRTLGALPDEQPGGGGQQPVAPRPGGQPPPGRTRESLQIAILADVDRGVLVVARSHRSSGSYQPPCRRRKNAIYIGLAWIRATPVVSLLTSTCKTSFVSAVCSSWARAKVMLPTSCSRPGRAPSSASTGLRAPSTRRGCATGSRT